MTTTRRMSDYCIEIAASATRNAVADALVARCPVPITGSGITESTAFLRYRATGDAEALRIAEIVTDLPHVLHTGYGVHRRQVN